MIQRRVCTLVGVIAILLASCLPPGMASRPLAAVAGTDTGSSVASPGPANETPSTPVPTPTMRSVKIEVGGNQTDGGDKTEVTVIPTPVQIATPTAGDETSGDGALSDEAAEDADATSLRAPLPVLTKGLTSDELRHVCGYGTVAAFDGHELRSTPELPLEGGNQVALLPENTRVFLIDCFVWIDDDLLPWLAVQTNEGKMGWMLVQPDKFYVQVLPVAHEPLRVTSIPPGSTVGYAPRQECQEQDTSTEARAASIAADFTPVVGDVKGLQEAATGCDAITGEPLGDWRWLGLLGLLGVAELATVRHVDDVADAARIAGKGEDIASAAGKNVDEAAEMAGKNLDDVAAAGRGGDDAAALGKNADEVGSTVGRNSDEVADASKNADEVGATAGRNGDDAVDAGRHIDDLAPGGGSLDAAGEVAYDANKAVSVGGSGVSVTELTARGYTADDAAYIASKFEQPCSFSADTEVATADGLVPISEIEIGDRVLAYHEAADETGYFAVTNVFAHLDPAVLYLTVGDEQIETTPDHPFYSEHEWVAASQLSVGSLLTSDSGAGAVVTGIRTERRLQVMYNLTVAEAHTYYVGDGGWLVHNACGKTLRQNVEKVGHEYIDAFDANHDMPWQAHHVIPKKYHDHRFMVDFATDWDIDNAKNAIPLPVKEDHAQYLCKATSGKYCLPRHVGSHNNYSDRVNTQLGLLYERAKLQHWDSEKSGVELQKLIDRLIKNDILTLPTGARLN